MAIFPKSYKVSKTLKEYLGWITIALAVVTLSAAISISGTSSHFVNQHTSALFIKQRELRTGDHWKTPALPAATAVKNLSKYRAIWGGQLIPTYHVSAWRNLRRGVTDQLILYYVSGNSVTKGDNLTTLDYEYINENHPEWFLINDVHTKKADSYRNKSSRIRWNPSDPNHLYYNRFFIDVGNKAFQSWAANELLKRIMPSNMSNFGYGYNGVAMDNVLLSVWCDVISKRYPKWKYADKTMLWNQSYFSYLLTLKNLLNNHGYKLVANHTTDYGSNRDGKDWISIMEVTDGLMDENALGPPSQPRWHGEKWLWSLKHHEETVDRGLIDWWVSYPSKDMFRGDAEFMYIYCSFLLVHRPGLSFFFADRGALGYSSPIVPWNPVYDLNLGLPKGKRFEEKGCWIRDYQNAKILVNPTMNLIQLAIFQGQELYYFNTGNIVSDLLEIPARSGKILVKP